MPHFAKKNLVAMAVVKILILGLLLVGCQEGTNKSPVSAILTGLDATQATVDLTTLGDDVAKHTIVGSVVSQNTGEKLANIAVTLFYDNQLAATTKTTSDGQFYFTKLPPGLFDLAFASADNTYASTTYTLRVLDDGTTSPANPEVKMSAVNPGQIKVIAKIEGEVMLSGTGTKLANINVELEDANGTLISTALTGTLGQFSFSNLGTGTYTIKAGKASNYEDGQQPVTIRNDGVVSPRYTIVSLATKPIENFSITGYVRSQNKEAVANIEVEIFDNTNLTKSSNQPTHTTGEGKFFFQNIKEARMYFLRANAGSSTGLSDPFPVRVLSDGTTSPAISEILVIRDETLKTYRLGGKIYDAFTGGPLEYATVKIGAINSAITDKNGQFFASDLLPGTYKLEVSKFGYESLSASFQVIQNEKATDEFRTIPATMSYPLLHDMKTGYGSIAGRYLDVSDGSGEPDLYVRLYKWSLVTKSGYITRVKYIDKDGAITYETIPITETDWQWSADVVLTTKTSAVGSGDMPDLEGSFKLTHLMPGYYLVYISSDIYSNPIDFSESRGGHFSWNVPSKIVGFRTEIRGLKVEAGKTTYWENYEQEYK